MWLAPRSSLKYKHLSESENDWSRTSTHWCSHNLSLPLKIVCSHNPHKSFSTSLTAWQDHLCATVQNREAELSPTIFFSENKWLPSLKIRISLSVSFCTPSLEDFLRFYLKLLKSLCELTDVTLIICIRISLFDTLVQSKAVNYLLQQKNSKANAEYEEHRFTAAQHDQSWTTKLDVIYSKL